MVGGKIFDYFIVDSLREESYEVKFLAKDTTYPNDYCCVEAEIPIVVLPQIERGGNIWWQSGIVFLNVFGYQDVEFRKIGYSGGGLKEFYAARSRRKSISSES